MNGSQFVGRSDKGLLILALCLACRQVLKGCYYRDDCCCCYCLVTQVCLTLCDRIDCSLPGSSVRRGSQPSPWVGPGKPKLPLGMRGKAGGCARVTAGPKRPHLGVCPGCHRLIDHRCVHFFGSPCYSIDPCVCFCANTILF